MSWHLIGSKGILCLFSRAGSTVGRGLSANLWFVPLFFQAEAPEEKTEEEDLRNEVRAIGSL